VDPGEIAEGPDVVLDVPVVKVDEIDLEVEDLHAQVAVLAQVQNLVQLSVGVEARLDRVELKIEGVEAQALLKARLDNVGEGVEGAVQELGQGAGQAGRPARPGRTAGHRSARPRRRARRRPQR
jgi:hypothetical protein